MTAHCIPEPRTRPNVIWVFGDQHRAQAMGHRGDLNLHTPNMDTLARHGMQFTCAVAGAPWCCPFRGAMLTSMYPHQNGVTCTPGALDPSLPTLVQPLREAGYHTAYVGKWHLAGSNAASHRVPPECRGGFDHWLGYENNNNQFECYVHGSGCEEGRRLPGYETDSLTDLFIDHLRTHVGEPGGDYAPFFAVLSVQPPHSPYVPPIGHRSSRHPADIQFRPNVPVVDWVRRKAALDLDGYYGMIENLDANIGRLRQALKDLDVDRDTFIVFFSDHGDMLGSHAQWEKSSPWEESIRIPFIVAKVGGVERMRVGSTDAVLNHVDIAPTTLGLCGIPALASMCGHDYSAHCRKGGALPSSAAEPDSAFLQQIPRKFHPHSINESWRGVVMRDGWKYVCLPNQHFLLHNTREDPYEMANLVFDSVFSEQRARCHARLQRWLDETGDRFPLPAL